MSQTKTQVLELLAKKEGYISGEEISLKLGLSRAAIWKAVDALRAGGWEIASAPRKGYRLIKESDVLNTEAVGLYLPEDIDVKLICLNETDSTNNYAKNLAVSGADETIIICESQSSGRGRMGRNFYSPSGMGIYMSYLFRPKLPLDKLTTLTARVAVAVCDAIYEASGFIPQIKWVNDIICPEGKLCGILTEISVESESGAISYAVAGVGINVRQSPEDFPPELNGIAASIKTACGKDISRPYLTALLIKHLKTACMMTMPGEYMERYRAACVTVGKDISVIRGGETKNGIALAIDDDAALIVRFENGETEKINAGEVSIRQPVKTS